MRHVKNRLARAVVELQVEPPPAACAWQPRQRQVSDRLFEGVDARVRGRGQRARWHVLRQRPDDEFRVEASLIADVGASPAVDGLICIAHDKDVPMVAPEERDDLVLQPVGVLELIHANVLPVP